MPRFSPQFLDELRARLRPSDVIGRHVKLRKEGREFRGLSPFTNEKTPSFYVNDEKGRFFDFSSGKSGDIINFLMDAQHLPFSEAVTTLAELAGLPLPVDSPAERARDAQAATLGEAMLAAARFFRDQLGRADGRAAAAYLDQRGVPAAMRDAFGLGYAPDSRTALRDHLVNKGFAPALQVEAGLLIQPEDGTAPYDRFRGRVMFPILQGVRAHGPARVIAFGGRAMAPDARAKYLNSPETPLFHKSHTLYNFDAARQVAAKTGRPLIVAEGYLDVIALHEAGWPAVAPLGTALTEAQMALLWRTALPPILCFDGDRAGRAAAYRAMDRALPLLAADKTLRFAFMPDGADPDALIRKDGAAAMDKVLGEARTFADVLWAREVETRRRGTPEEVAAFRGHLRTLVGTIGDPDVRAAYRDFLAERLAALMPRAGSAANAHAGGGGSPATRGGQQPRAGGRSGPWAGGTAGSGKGGRTAQGRMAVMPAAASPELLARTRGPAADQGHVPEAVLIIGLIRHPALFAAHENAVLALAPGDPGLATLLSATIDALLSDPALDSEGVCSHILKNPAVGHIYQEWGNHRQVQLERNIRTDAPFEKAEAAWLSALSKYRYLGDLEAEVVDAAAAAHRDERQERIWRDALSHRSRSLRGSENEPGAAIARPTSDEPDKT